jgi:hypothetical protein
MIANGDGAAKYCVTHWKRFTQGRTGKSIGSSFRELKRTTDLEYAVMNDPLVRKWLTRDVE